MTAVRKQGSQDALYWSEILIISVDPLVHGFDFEAINSQGIAVSMVRDGDFLSPKVSSGRKPDLMLLDFSLPDIDGNAICKQLKACVDTKDIPVVLMLAKDDLDRRALGFQAGAVDYLIKPLVLEEVTAKLSLHFRQLPMPLQSADHSECLEMPSHRNRDDAGCLKDVCTDRPIRGRYFGDFGVNRALEAGAGLPGYGLRGQFAGDFLEWGGDEALLENTVVKFRCNLEAGNVLDEKITPDFLADQRICPSTPPLFDDSVGNMYLSRNITEHKRPGTEVQRHLRFFESMDKVNRAIQGPNDLETVLNDVLDNLQASEREFRALAENAPFGIARYDVHGRISYFNPALEKILHITTVEAQGKRPTECFSAEIYREYEQALLQVATNGEQIEFELKYPGDDGLETGMITMVALHDDAGSINGVLAIGRNVTAQRRAESALQYSEALYRSMVTAMIEGVIVQSRDGNIVSINPGAEKILNLSADTVLGTSSLDGVLQILTKDGKPLPDDQHPARVSLRTGQPQSDVELGLSRDDGEFVWILVNSQPLFQEGESRPYAVVTTYHDITERKRVEAEKLKSIAIFKQNETLLTERLMLERRFSRMANHVPGFLYTFKVDADGQGSFPYVSSGVRNIFGLRPEDVAVDMTPLHDRVHPDDRQSLDKTIAEAVQNVVLFHHEFRICHPVKGVLWLEAKAMPTLKDDGSIVFHGFMQDICERKRVEHTLKFIAQSGWQESRGAFLVSLANFMAQMLDVDYVLIDKSTADPAFAETLVISRRGEILPNMRYQLAGTPCNNVMEGALCCYPDSVQQKFPEDTLLKDMGVESYAGLPLRDSAGNAIGLIAVLDGKPLPDSERVVSILQLVAIRVAAELEREKFEKVLAESRQFLHSVIDAIAEPVFVKNRRHRWVLANAAFCKLIGHPQEVLLGKSDYDFFPREHADEIWARDEEVFRTGEENVNEENFTDCNGDTRRIITKKTRYIDDNGEGVLVGIMMDITERKRMEAMIRRGEEEFRTLAENLPDIIVRYDTSFRRTYINKVYSKMLGPLDVELLGKTPKEFWKALKPDADEFTRILERVIDTGNPETTLIQSETWTGKMIYWTMNLVPEFDPYGEVNGVLSCATDVTELKEYQREIEKSRSQLRALASRNEILREGERKHIARELHDDLGQRLTALKLDLSRLTLRFGQNNLELRQQVQEMEVDMGATIQIVRGVATSLRPSALEMGIVSALEWLVQEFRKRTNISCRLRLPNRKIVLDDSQATVLFRIVQESLTNIMRYAMASEVEIVLSSDDQQYVLEINDDGVGFNVNEKRKAGSFGLIGIEERAMSLGGDMCLQTAPDQGLKLTVRIPVSLANGEQL